MQTAGLLVNEAIFELQTITYFAVMIKIILIHLFTGELQRAQIFGLLNFHAQNFGEFVKPVCGFRRTR